MGPLTIVFLVVAGVGLFTAAMGGALGWTTGQSAAVSRDNNELRADLQYAQNEMLKLRTNLTIMEHLAAATTTTAPVTFSDTTISTTPSFLRVPNVKVQMPRTNTKRPKSQRNKRSASSKVWGEVVTDDATTLVVLSDDASVDLDNKNKTGYETHVLESGLISPQLGLVMEQTGSYLEYSGFIYVPIIYHMPHLIEAGLIGSGVSCNITANPEHQKLIINMLKEKIGTLIPQNRHGRQKRFIETLFVGGVAAWNRASIWSLQDTVESLDKQISDMKTHNQIVVDSINTLIDNQHAIHHAVDRQARLFRDFMEKSTCAELVTNYFREVYSTWLSMAPNDFARVVDNALSGKITPDILPATDVISTLLRHPALVNTAYSKDMTLLYELGKLSLHKVSFDPYPMVSGIMIFPRIILDRSAALMKIHTTHLPAKEGYRKLSLPDTVACKSPGNCWEISPTACREMLTLTLCPKQSRPDFNSCLYKIFHDSKPATSCEWKLASNPELEVLQFDGGVLISASTIGGEVMITQGKEVVVHKVIEPSLTPVVLTAEDGDFLHIGGQIYQLSQDTIKTGYDININFTMPTQQSELEGLDVEGWIEENRIEQLRSEPWAPPRHYTWWTLIGALVAIMVIGALVIKYRVHLHRVHDKVKREVSGWMTVPSAPPTYSTRAPGGAMPTDMVV